MIFLGEIISSILANLKSTFATPCAPLVSRRVRSIFKRSFLSFRGISVIQLSGIFSGFIRLYWILPDVASHQEYTTGENFSINSSKLSTNNSSLISLILSSSRLFFPRTSPISVNRFDFSGLISLNRMVLFVCVIVSIGSHSPFIFSAAMLLY